MNNNIQERLRQMEENRRRLLAQMDEDEDNNDDVVVEENLAGFDTDSVCYDTTKNDFSGDNISKNNDIVLIVDPLTDPRQKLIYCFTSEDLLNSFKNSRRLWEWNRGPIYDKPIFKIPIQYGRYIDYPTFLEITRNKYNTILLTSFTTYHMKTILFHRAIVVSHPTYLVYFILYYFI